MNNENEVIDLIERLRGLHTVSVGEICDRLAELESELQEQCRLHGAGAEREAALLGKVERLKRENAELRASMNKTPEPMWGCHCDLEIGMKPDGCVIDEGRRQDCLYAYRNNNALARREDCEYWRPIIMANLPSSKKS